MPTIQQITKAFDRRQSNGKRIIKYKIEILDNENNTIIENYGPFFCPIDFDAEAYKTEITKTILSKKEEIELDDIKSSLENGKNPFTKGIYKYHSREILLSNILKEMLSLPLTDPMLFNGFKFLSSVTDAELQNIFGINKPQTTNLRKKIDDAMLLINQINNYVPVI